MSIGQRLYNNSKPPHANYHSTKVSNEKSGSRGKQDPNLVPTIDFNMKRVPDGKQQNLSGSNQRQKSFLNQTLDPPNTKKGSNNFFDNGKKMAQSS